MSAPASFACPRCGAESFNVHDVDEGYCGRCHAFTRVDDDTAGRRHGVVVRYRVGRKLGRTIYRQFGAEPSDEDEFVGIMDSRLDAAVFVEVMNEAAADEPRAREWMGGTDHAL